MTIKHYLLLALAVIASLAIVSCSSNKDVSKKTDISAAPSGKLESFALKAKNVVFVSDYIYSDATNFDELTELYRKGLARIDREVSKICHKVTEVTFGRKIEYKG